MHQILKKTLDPIYPNTKDWPIYKISQEKDIFLKEVKDITRSKILSKVQTEKELNDLLGKVLYAERIRLTQKAWKADPADEREFWSNIKNELLKIHIEEQPIDITENSPNLAILNKIMDRYANEIVGNFKPAMYEFAKKNGNCSCFKNFKCNS